MTTDDPPAAAQALLDQMNAELVTLERATARLDNARRWLYFGLGVNLAAAAINVLMIVTR
jgi:DNA-binding MurR/RpiR family transcriptional regulator